MHQHARWTILHAQKSVHANIQFDEPCNIWRLSDCNGTQTQNHLVCKWTLNYLAKQASLAKWFSVCLPTMWLWVWVPIQSLHLFMIILEKRTSIVIILEKRTSIVFSVHKLPSLKKPILHDWKKYYTCLDWCIITSQN